jgi:hypothetical protein
VALPAGRSCIDRTKEGLNHGKELFLDHCNHAMAKSGRVTIAIVANEPHKVPFPRSFNKELCPLCYENLMAAIAEVFSIPNQVSAARLVQADAGALIEGPELTNHRHALSA